MTNKVKKQITVDGKIAKLVVYRDTPLEGYYITKDGDLYSVHLSKSTTRKSGGFDYKNPQKRTPFKNPSGYVQYQLYVTGKLNTKTFFDLANRRTKPTGHALVMNTWRPLTKYTFNLGFSPTEFKKSPKNIQNALRETVIINHINHIKTDNRVENLEWCTHRHNSIAARNHYKGKKKKK